MSKKTSYRTPCEALQKITVVPLLRRVCWQCKQQSGKNDMQDSESADPKDYGDGPRHNGCALPLLQSWSAGPSISCSSGRISSPAACVAQECPVQAPWKISKKSQVIVCHLKCLGVLVQTVFSPPASPQCL